jgi:hypothetical protein
MHRNHWIPADDRTKVFWLFGCYLKPQVSHLTPAPGCSLSPIASSLSPASGSLISIESLVGPGASTRRKTPGLGLSSEFTFPLAVEVGEHPIDWQTRATGALDRSPFGDPFGPNAAGFGHAKRDIGSGTLSELRSKSGRTLNLPASGPCA